MTGEAREGGVPKAVVVGVGDELLFGETVNTNGSWLGQELSVLGFSVLRQAVVGDDEGTIQEAVREGVAVAELVVLTGGLGPTPDDRTRPAVTHALGYSLEEDPGLVEQLRRRFRLLGYDEIPENNRRMAQVPRGAEILPNPVGAAPGLVMESDGGETVVLLPGIPAEMRGLFLDELSPRLRTRFGGRLVPILHRTIHTTGIAESILATKIGSILPIDDGPVSIAFLPDLRGTRVRLTTQGVPEGEATRLFDEIEMRLEPALAPFRFKASTGDLSEALGSALASSGAFLAVAESCTGGLIAKRITDLPGSSRYFRGGVVAYGNEVKSRLLGVPGQMLREEGAVSRAVAEAMATGVAEKLDATAAIGITGVAGPDGGSEEKPVGTVCYAALFEDTVAVRQQRFLGNREAVRERAGQAAMALLLALAEGREP